MFRFIIYNVATCQYNIFASDKKEPPAGCIIVQELSTVVFNGGDSQ